MTRTFFIPSLLLLCSCAADEIAGPSPAPPDETSASPRADDDVAPADQPSGTPGIAEGGEPAKPGITDDVRLIIGGRSAADHIGPQEHDALFARLRGQPLEYLAEGVRFAKRANHRQLGGTFVSYLVRVVGEPPTTRAQAENAARELLPIYQKALDDARANPSDEFEPTRLSQEIAQLDRLANGKWK
ncbi:MAG: hypothetical protein HOW73_15665 [Polyangiaceae bacterium]|nr:hypothetical protein [Polyangiaceae bacterium]